MHDTLMDDEGNSPRQEADSAPLFVALYIVLLAFFIVLNVIAKEDAVRTKMAVQSVVKTFHVPDELMKKRIVGTDQGFEAAVKFFSGRMRDVTSDFLALEQIKLTLQGDKMYLRMPVDQLFYAGTSTIRPRALKFLGDLNRQVQRFDSGSIRVRISLPGLTKYNPIVPIEEATSDPDIQRLGKLARFLEDVGMPSEVLLVGMNTMLDSQEIEFAFNFDASDSGDVAPVQVAP